MKQKAVLMMSCICLVLFGLFMQKVAATDHGLNIIRTDGKDGGYLYKDEVLIIIDGGDFTIGMENPENAESEDLVTSHRIKVSATKEVNLTLNGVKIDASNKEKAALFVGSLAPVHIMLQGENSLKSGSWHAGLEKAGGYELTISQKEGEKGSLEAIGGDGGGAGIGSGGGENVWKITVNSGEITAKGGGNAAGIGAGNRSSSYGGTHSGGNAEHITINGGVVKAIAGIDAAAIGCAREGYAKNIFIHGGDITAIANASGAAIGSGYRGEGVTNITITGGKINAKGDGSGAGIGSGSNSKQDGIHISGGEIEAISSSGAAIGGGYGVMGKNIIISGGKIIAKSVARENVTYEQKNGAGIGSGASSSSQAKNENIKMKGGNIYASGLFGSAGIGGGHGVSGGEIEITGGNIKSVGSEGAQDIGNGKGAKAISSIQSENGQKLYPVVVDLSLFGKEKLIESSQITSSPQGEVYEYHLNHVTTDEEGKLRVYLPEGEYKAKFGGDKLYHYSIKIENDSELPIEVKPSAMMITEPEFLNHLVFNAEIQSLLSNEPEVEGGVLQYKVLEEGQEEIADKSLINDEIAKARDAKKYVIYYYLKADEHHEDSEIYKSSVEIKKAVPKIALEKVINKTESMISAVLSVKLTEVFEKEPPTGTISFIDLSKSDSEEIGSKNLKEAAAQFDWENLENKDYRIKAVYEGDENYQSAESTVLEFHVSKEDQEALHISPIEAKIYGDEAFSIEAAGGSTEAEIVFESTQPDILSISGNIATIHRSGQVTIVAKKAGNLIYNEITDHIVLNISPKRLIVRADDKEIHTNEAFPNFTFTVEGLVQGDAFTNPLIEANVSDSSTAGNYDILISGGELDKAQNYSITYIKGKLTIIKSSADSHDSTGSSGSSSNFDNSSSYQDHSSREEGSSQTTYSNKKITVVKKTDLSTKREKSKSETQELKTIKQLIEEKGEAIIEIEKMKLHLNEQTLLQISKNKKGVSEGSIKIQADFSVKDKLTSMFTSDVKEKIGDRPVVKLSLQTPNGAFTEKFSGNDMKVSLPYLLKQGEEANRIAIYQIDENEKMHKIEYSVYDAKSKEIIFKTDSFSTFAVYYEKDSVKSKEEQKHWARESLDFVRARGLLQAQHEGNFNPSTKISRSMFVTALGKLALIDEKELSEHEVKLKFEDVKEEDPDYPFVNWAYNFGITKGVGDNKFDPISEIAREQMAVMLDRYLVMQESKDKTEMENDTLDESYEDASEISEFAKNSVKKMRTLGIMTGVSEQKFAPKEKVSIAEFAVILQRLIYLSLQVEK